VKPENGKYIKSLTGLRAIAAYMVFIMHYNWADPGGFLYKFFSQFYTGVSIFFVLSGFLITYRYGKTYSISTEWFIKYFKNRAARIYPLYFFLTTLTLICGLATTSDSNFSSGEILKQNAWVYVANITFVRGFFEDLLFTLIGQGWSLSVEEVFYFTVPFMWYWRKKTPLLLQAAILCLLGLLLVEAGQKFTFYGFFASDVFMLKFTFFGRALQFIAGMFVGHAFLNRREWRIGFVKKTYVGLIITVASLVAMGLLWKTASIYYSIAVDLVLISAGVALFISGLTEEDTFISRFLSTDVMELLGKSSYAFYLVHLGIFHEMIETAGVDNLLLRFILLNIISMIFYKALESPVRAFIVNIKLRNVKLFKTNSN